MRNEPTSFGAAPHAARGARRSLSSILGVLVFLLVLVGTAGLVSVAVLARVSPAIERRVVAPSRGGDWHVVVRDEFALSRTPG